MKRCCFVVIIAFLASACSSKTPEPAPAASATDQPGVVVAGMKRVPATIAFHGDGPEIVVPAGARVGEAIPVSVTTYGGGCTKEDTTAIVVEGLTARIAPYQRVPVDANTMCTMELLLNKRALRVTFTSPGRASVRIEGRVMPGDSSLVVSRSVEVRSGGQMR